MAPAAQSEGPRTSSTTMRNSELGNPIPRVKVDLTEDDFRESAYEIMLAATGTAALSARSVGSARSKPDKGITAVAASRMKKALGLKLNTGVSRRGGKPRTTAELMRDQMLIADTVDLRTRRALSRAAAGQASRRTEHMLVPLELLQNIPASAFTDSSEHVRWLKRQLRILEAGLLAHPLVRGDSQGVEALRLRQCLKEMYCRASDTGKNTESIQALRNAAMARAGRPLNGESNEDVLHWADGYPFNINLYVALLGCVFDHVEEGTVLEELDDMLEMFKKTWVVLGIDQLTHNMLFMWVLFRQYVNTGQKELDLLGAAESQMAEVVKDYKSARPEQWNLLHSILTAIQTWTERRLLSYHDSFPEGARGPLEKVLALAVQSAEVIGEDMHQDKRRKVKISIAISTVDLYVRSSIRTAFAQMMESVDTRRKAADAPIPALAQLAKDTSALVSKEIENFSPSLKEWHPYAGGVAAVTLHACYSREIKQYMSGVSALTADTVQVLEAADQLEKSLVQVVVEDGVYAEDGGKALIREMPPFEADRAVGNLAKKWVEEKLQMLKEMVTLNVSKESWEPNSLKERYASSAVELLRIVDEMLNTYFALPVSQFPELLQDLVNGIDNALKIYATQAIGSCGEKDALIPPIPPLTRCKTKKSWFGKGRSDRGSPKPKGTLKKEPSSAAVYDLPHICLRMNTLHHLLVEVDFIEKKIRTGWRKDSALSGHVPSMQPNTEAVDSNLYETRSLLKEGIDKLMEIAAYRVVFVDLRPVLWDRLYVGGVASSRISAVIEELDTQLGIISDSSVEQLSNRVIGSLMRACFEGLMLVLMAAGPMRSFTVSDASMLQEDLKSMKDLFIADGDGLPATQVEREAAFATEVVSLFSLPTSEVIQRFNSVYGIGKGGTKPSLPSITGTWSASDPDTLLRILCYRGDDTASKYLKKTFRLPNNE
ncbi:protein unc-13 homolog [Physcomitrium patens]|nr:uncharacterized protein LOC112294600 [Physcomitrium patens]XP_024401009.1 uncharacterized protein LOC112294600 [Physcomitrium patens]XP_024401010.1 uncharacterized protein LOC112294600 [Physcomitrium patens]PNR35687.1 hypothetical protein PHYPA_021537 [Physcomitrium patens]|eukprot:XP_024401007.1 uncharacterized protein LOC112294600 [Physcomitrella patens]